jgi:alkanesulfonate monooxygenase SsuD/methylene tetrahydromethanopterin reductase-like flavin-dependent oxidoreductase (luciferase family)
MEIGVPVRVFENFATLHLLLRGRAEMIAGRGAFPAGATDAPDRAAQTRKNAAMAVMIPARTE